MREQLRTGSIARVALFLALSSVALGCASPSNPPTPTVAPTATPDLAPADETAFAFLQAWQRADYPAMYSLLSPASRAQYTEERFNSLYAELTEKATVQNVVPSILTAYQSGNVGTVSFAVTLKTTLFGDLQVENEMGLTFGEGLPPGSTVGRWGVDWSPALILPQLSDDTFLQLTEQGASRGNIYDRNGLGLAVQGELVEIGVVPGKIQDEATMLAQLSTILGQSPADLQARYASARPDWYVPMGRIKIEAAEAYYDVLSTTPGIELRRSWTRSYNTQGIAPHVIGIVGPIPADELDSYRARGYSGDEIVGRMGLERWGEAYLTAERQARLQIVSSRGDVVAVLAERPAQENPSIYTTFDREFQKKVQDILGEHLGAIVVLEAQTGRVLALATYPSFDPNLFQGGIDAQQWQALQADGQRPLVNRATQGTYPAGSMFKVVSMMAGMGAAGMTGNTTFVCRGVWTGLGPQWRKTCWAAGGHGTIALSKGLTVSCDITFYEVGMQLDAVGNTVLPDYARRCGFGAKTGIEVEEEAGLVPDPAWKLQAKGEGWATGDTVNLAIGQADLEVTPLQAATLYAAIGNGGTLYRPQVVEMIAADPSQPEVSFAPVVAGKLPISAENLAVMQDALSKVTSSPSGTAYTAFKGLSLPVAGKTGTAESGQTDPHAWFAGYAPAQNPEIAIAVIVEHAGQGSTYAAPLFRKVVEAYFNIQPPTPAPTATRAPAPAHTATPLPSATTTLTATLTPSP